MNRKKAANAHSNHSLFGAPETGSMPYCFTNRAPMQIIYQLRRCCNRIDMRKIADASSYLVTEQAQAAAVEEKEK